MKMLVWPTMSAKKELSLGDQAPNFQLVNQNNEMVKLSAFKGQSSVIIYFYPKDFTSGCTQEACAFGEVFPQFKSLNTVILGISKDSVESHKKFKDKYKLPFDLLSDVDGKICEKYGVWKKKSMYGREYMGIERSTFLIDSKGILRTIFSKVKVKDHEKAVLEALKNLNH